MDEFDEDEFVEDFILDLVRNTGFMDVYESLWEYADEVDEDLARELHDRITHAKVEVKFD